MILGFIDFIKNVQHTNILKILNIVLVGYVENCKLIMITFSTYVNKLLFFLWWLFITDLKKGRLSVWSICDDIGIGYLRIMIYLDIQTSAASAKAKTS